MICALSTLLAGAAAWTVPQLSTSLAVSSLATRCDHPNMCGILAVSGSKTSSDALRLQTLTLQRLIRHRGPDGSGVHVMENQDGTHSAIAHERLAIMDPLSGNQPLFSKDGKLSLAVNGEIYNYKELRARVNDESKFRTFSDCEPIVHLYEQVGEEVASLLDGDFALVIMNEDTGELYAARDPVGVNSLYWGTGLDGATWFASEAKPLVTAGCLDVEMFPPGHYYTTTGSQARVSLGGTAVSSVLQVYIYIYIYMYVYVYVYIYQARLAGRNGRLVKYYNPEWADVAHATKPIDLPLLQQTFMNAVSKRMMADVP